VTALPVSMRRAQILEQIQREGGVTIAELTRKHSISTMTAHRDLEQLAREGLIERIRGGARALPGTGGAVRHPTAWEQRVKQAPEAKRAIAAHVAPMVSGGSTIFLDSSSTALALARQLALAPPYELTLVTNSPMLVAEIRADAIHVVVCPGELGQQMRAVTGTWTAEFIRGLNFDIAFISGAGLTLDTGLTTSRGPIADVLRAARESAVRTVGLVDATKFGRASLVTIARAQELDLLVTDHTIDEAVAREFSDAGVPLEIAAPHKPAV
jgi:DeoR/GlpR family transcriptional regulator of sugar metabolism